MMKYVPLWIFKSRPFQAFLYHVYFRYWCPAPIVRELMKVRDCVASGQCGCNNARRFR